MAASSCCLDKMIIFKALAKVKAWRRHELWVFLAKHSTHFGRRNHETKIVRMKDAFMKPEACRQCTFGSWGRGCWSCTVWSFSSEKWQKTFSWCIRTLGLIRVKDTHTHSEHTGMHVPVSLSVIKVYYWFQLYINTNVSETITIIIHYWSIYDEICTVAKMG